MTRRYCQHCDVDRTAYNVGGGLCRACREYLRKYEKMPPEEVLVERQARRDERRFRREAQAVRAIA